MPYGNLGINSIEAGEDLSAKDYYFVQLDANGELEVGEGATDLLVGILMPEGNVGGAGTHATYQSAGVAKLKLGVGGATVGAWITSDASGTGIVTTTDGNLAVRALEAGDEGDIISVQLPLVPLYIA